MFRNLVLWTLVSVLPLGGMRMVCIDPMLPSPQAEALVAVAEPAPAPDPDECERLCALHRPPSTPTGDESGSEPGAKAGNATGGQDDCSLTAGDASMIIAGGSVAPPIQQILRQATAGRHTFDEPIDAYLDPLLSLFSPPPRA